MIAVRDFWCLMTHERPSWRWGFSPPLGTKDRWFVGTLAFFSRCVFDIGNVPVVDVLAREKLPHPCVLILYSNIFMR